MLDPRFAATGANPFLSGFTGAQQVPMHYHHHHRHHHKHKSRKDQSPLSRDESIHKVDHGQTHAFQQNEGANFHGGYGVPYGAAGGFAVAGGYGQQQQQQQYFGGGAMGYSNQYASAPYPQGAFAAAYPPQTVRHHRRHHRHHRQPAAEAVNLNAAVEQSQAVPEQLIGQRSSSVLRDEAGQARSPVPAGEVTVKSERKHRHRHHRSGERADFGHSRRHHNNQSVGGDGYGHINEDLIFIERGDHSPHRQDPPAGYEYKGKIEVQGVDRERRSQSRGNTTNYPLPPAPGPIIPPTSNIGPCPPGWQQMILSAAPGGPCPPGASMFTAQMVGATGVAHGGYNVTGTGYGVGGVGQIGTGVGAGGLSNLAASYPLPSQGQLIADYIVDSNAGGASSSIDHGHSTVHRQTSGTNFVDQFHSGGVEEHVSGRTTVIEVWQKRSKSQTGDKSRSRSRSRERTRSPRDGSSLNLEGFRRDILAAIERIAQRGGGGGGKTQWTGHDGGTQTQIHSGGDGRREERRTETGPGEVRVIVQPIQPVFYMPRQTSSGSTPQVGPIPIAPGQPTTSGGAPNVVYVPRNVYVPVIKPVFVPRERVIVRPQVIHVARPVLVDRPVPVTQRPIIIDRERPVPVPVRGAQQEAAQSGSSNIAREEYVYRDNLPVAYGGRCAEFAGGINYGYMPTQQEHQYAASSTHEVSTNYQSQAPIINVNVPNQFQQSHSSSHVEVQPDAGSFHGSYSNLVHAASDSAVNMGQINHQVLQQTFDQSTNITGAPLHCATQIEVLDTAVNPFWQKTDQSTLMRRYGRPAYEIVHKTDQVEQQMYNELRQNAAIQRSSSSASYGSASGIGLNASAGFDASNIPQY